MIDWTGYKYGKRGCAVRRWNEQHQFGGSKWGYVLHVFSWLHKRNPDMNLREMRDIIRKFSERYSGNVGATMEAVSDRLSGLGIVGIYDRYFGDGDVITFNKIVDTNMGWYDFFDEGAVFSLAEKSKNRLCEDCGISISQWCWGQYSPSEWAQSVGIARVLLTSWDIDNVFYHWSKSATERRRLSGINLRSGEKCRTCFEKEIAEKGLANKRRRKIRDGKTVVYAIDSIDSETVYIGISNSWMTRLKQHYAQKKWQEGEFGAFRILQRFENRDEAERYEILLISQLKPKYNRAHNPRYAK